MQIEISDDDLKLLSLALGIAAGYADSIGNPHLVRQFMRLANTIHKDVPPHLYTPYDLGPDPE